MAHITPVNIALIRAHHMAKFKIRGVDWVPLSSDSHQSCSSGQYSKGVSKYLEKIK